MISDAERVEQPPTLSFATRRAARGFAVAATLYVALAAVAIAISPHSPRIWRLIPDWIAVPVQLIAIFNCAVLLPNRRHAPRTRSVWLLVGAFCVVSLAANIVWNLWRPLGAVPALSSVDLYYLADYALMTAAYAALFVRYGGSFRDLRTWLDIAIIVIALLGMFWGGFLATFLPPAQAPKIGMPYALTYATSVAVWMATAVLLFLRMPSFRLVPLLLLLAGLCDALWEIGWLATWLTDRNYVGYYYNFGDVLCFALIACAAALSSAQPTASNATAATYRSAHAFVPTLAILLAIGLFGASLASTRAPDAWILVALVLLTAILLVARHSAASRKLAELNRVLAFRVADARLTELVRQSADAYLIVDARGLVVFASPAIYRNAGIPASSAVGARAALLFGVEHEDALTRFFGRLLKDRHAPAAIELSLEPPDRPHRVLRIRGANKLDNAHIDGLTLTISDISAQREVEREVLMAANRERVRLAGDIHEGLGQELSGIAFMLQGLTKAGDLGAAQPRTELRSIVDQMRAAIHGARDLARGISPIYVVRGSLCDALQRLSREHPESLQVEVSVDASLAGLMFEELPADHLYRIAREAVENTLRCGASQVEIRLRRADPHLLLEIASGPTGNSSVMNDDYSLRLMEYRARIIGATFDIARRESGGSLILIAARLWNVAREPTV